VKKSAPVIILGKASTALTGRDENPRQSARQMGPYLAYLNMANGIAINVLTHEDGTSVGLLGGLKISLKLVIS
jgi:hypothetical protein